MIPITARSTLSRSGSGKTTLLERTLEKLAKEMKIAVIEGDLFTSKDADRIAKHGAEVIQVNTSGGCHLEAPMIEKALSDIDWQSMDMLVKMSEIWSVPLNLLWASRRRLRFFQLPRETTNP